MNTQTMPASGLPMNRRRVIGPVPPRARDGKLQIKPALEKRVKLNVLGEPVRDEKGQPIEEMVDTRQPLEYRLYEPGHENAIADGATKGLQLFQVEYDAEPIMQVYARDKAHAAEVYKKEWGITRVGDSDPVVILIGG